jgi:hypothetical protein
MLLLTRLSVEVQHSASGLACFGTTLTNASMRQRHTQEGRQIILHCYACRAQIDYLDGAGVIQTVRATPSFFNHKWYDCVLVVSGGEGGLPRHAKLLALFWHDDQELALVRYFATAPRLRSDALASGKEPWRCTALSWAMRESVDGVLEPDVQVVHVRSLISSAYIVPDFHVMDEAAEKFALTGGDDAVSRWHVSAFKYPRAVPDRRPLPDKLIGLELPPCQTAASMGERSGGSAASLHPDSIIILGGAMSWCGSDEEAGDDASVDGMDIDIGQGGIA